MVRRRPSPLPGAVGEYVRPVECEVPCQGACPPESLLGFAREAGDEVPAKEEVAARLPVGGEDFSDAGFVVSPSGAPEDFAVARLDGQVDEVAQVAVAPEGRNDAVVAYSRLDGSERDRRAEGPDFFAYG